LVLEWAYLGSLAVDDWRDSTLVCIRLTALETRLDCTGDALLDLERLADTTPDT
jgi:hypothetical protein